MSQHSDSSGPTVPNLGSSPASLSRIEVTPLTSGSFTQHSDQSVGTQGEVVQPLLGVSHAVQACSSSVGAPLESSSDDPKLVIDTDAPSTFSSSDLGATTSSSPLFHRRFQPASVTPLELICGTQFSLFP